MIDDPLLKAIYSAIKPGIDVTFDADLFGSSLILIYSGIDAMAWLNMPSLQENVNRQDFINWVEAYFPNEFTSRISGIELYSARCAVVHSYGVESTLTRSDPNVRSILYQVGGLPSVKYAPSVDPAYVMVELGYVRDCFYEAIDAFLVKAFADEARAAVIERRAPKLLNAFPYQPPNQS